MIELVFRCRTCGTECNAISVCDACGERPVGIWKPAQKRFLLEEEVGAILRQNAQEEAARKWEEWRLRDALGRCFTKFDKEHPALLAWLIAGFGTAFLMMLFICIMLFR